MKNLSFIYRLLIGIVSLVIWVPAVSLLYLAFYPELQSESLGAFIKDSLKFGYNNFVKSNK